MLSRSFSGRVLPGLTRGSVRCASVPALHTPLPSAKAEEFVAPAPQTSQVTRLDNGVRVATVELHGNLASVGLVVDSGSRDEHFEQTGFSHILQQLAFKSTDYRSTFRLTRQLDQLGATPTATTTRETLTVGVDLIRSRAIAGLELAASSVVDAVVYPWELKEATEVSIERSEEVKHQPTALLREHVHTSAFYGNSLGKPYFARKADYLQATSENVSAFLRSQLTGDRVCVSAVNVDHDLVVQYAKSALAALPAAREAREAAVYTGGEYRSEVELPATHLALAFRGAAWSKKDYFGLAVLQAILSGGPLSRLSRHISSKDGFVSATAFNTAYTDSGVFGILAEVQPKAARGAVTDLADQLLSLTGSIDAAEIARAKKRLAANVWVYAEQKSGAFGDLGRQVLATNKRLEAEEFTAQIESVSASDLAAVVAKTLKTPLTFVAHGNLESVPRYNEVATRFK